MAEEKLQKADCIALLQDRYRALQAQGIARYPQRADFSAREIVAIKAFFGPWPRALEAAGIKPPVDKENKAQKAKAR